MRLDSATRQRCSLLTCSCVLCRNIHITDSPHRSFHGRDFDPTPKFFSLSWPIHHPIRHSFSLIRFLISWIVKCSNTNSFSTLPTATMAATCNGLHTGTNDAAEYDTQSPSKSCRTQRQRSTPTSANASAGASAAKKSIPTMFEHTN